MVRVLQISDSHLSAIKPHFASNWQALRARIAAQKPELIIHTGDITVDGADIENDMSHCAAMLHALQAPVLAVPGNHDVGEVGHPHQPVNPDRLARWRSHFGHDHWSRDIENWRLIGLNAMLFGDGGPDEATQRVWLEQTMTSAGGRVIAWFIHRPLFVYRPDEGETGYWSVKPGPRTDLFALARKFRVKLVASGHLHKAYDCEVDGVRFVWCPSSGFLVGPDQQPDLPGERKLGAVNLEFYDSEVDIAVKDVPGLRTAWIDDVLHEVYPPQQAACSLVG